MKQPKRSNRTAFSVKFLKNLLVSYSADVHLSAAVDVSRSNAPGSSIVTSANSSSAFSISLTNFFLSSIIVFSSSSVASLSVMLACSATLLCLCVVLTCPVAKVQVSVSSSRMLVRVPKLLSVLLDVSRSFCESRCRSGMDSVRRSLMSSSPYVLLTPGRFFIGLIKNKKIKNIMTVKNRITLYIWGMNESL